MRSYYLSAAGRRITLLLLAAAVAIWLFALWSLRTTLNLSYSPLQFWSSLNTTLAGGLRMDQLVPALLMLVVIVATPLVVWNLLEEWAALYTVNDEGLRFESLGIDLICPWETVRGLRSIDDSDETQSELLLITDPTTQIRQPILRWLHRQAFGRTRLPLYANIEGREQLIEMIEHRIKKGMGNDFPLMVETTGSVG